MTQNPSGHVRPSSAPASPRPSRPGASKAPAPGRFRLPKGFSGIGGMLICALVVSLGALLLQGLWPNGFPLKVKAAARSGAITQVYSSGPVRINEIMSSNALSLVTSDGQSPDWVEIFNTSSSAVNLEGYSLAKRQNAAAVFTFPAMTLEAGTCVLVYCDSTLREDPQAELHAPFRLSSSGDTLMLFSPTSTAVDSVNIPALSRNESYVRLDRTSWISSKQATPGLANTQEEYQSMVSAVTEDAVEITEVMASNKTTISDGDGEYPDYLELHNTSGEEISLKGYFLSDTSQSPLKWRFPDVTIPAGGYLVVFASGKDKVDDNQNLHTNFKLASEGEEVVLSNPQGQIVDEMSYGLSKGDVAYTRQADGSFTTSLPASPGQSNE